jgi:hypothetical protein
MDEVTSDASINKVWFFSNKEVLALVDIGLETKTKF